MIAEDMRTLLMCYWRFTRGCYLVASEFSYGDADIISLGPKDRTVYETEIKVTVADLKRERRKTKHSKLALWGTSKLSLRGHYFLFAIPEDISQAAITVCNEFFPYAGLLVVKNFDSYLANNDAPYRNPPIEEIKRPKRLSMTVVKEEDLIRLIRGMTNNLCSISYKMMKLKNQGTNPE